MRHTLVGRRTFIARLAGSSVALGLGAVVVGAATPNALAQEAPGLAERRQPVADAPIPVRLGEVSQAGAEFRAGLADGVRLPVAGGDSSGLRPERPGARFTSEPLQIDFPCSHVGVHWLADGGRGQGEQGKHSVQVEVRGSRDGVRWSGWRRVRVEAHGPDRESASSGRETFGALVGGHLATWLQYRLTFAEAGPEPPWVERVTLTYLDSRAPPGAETSPRGFSSLVARAGLGAFLERVITREEWGADESIRFIDGKDQWPRAFVSPKLLVVHHTAGDNEYAAPAAEVRAIYTYHTVTEGFGDIGYQLLIDNRGQAYEGRLGREVDPDGGPGREILSRDVVAGHVFGYNYGSVGIALLGTFIEAEPTESALQTLEEALAFEAARHHLGPASQIDFLRSRKRSGDDDLWRDGLNAVSGHRDCLATECPGDRLYARLPGLRGGVAARLGSPGPEVRIVRGPEDRDTWPGDLVFGWEGDSALEFSARLEGWRLSEEPDLIVPLSGYTEDERELWGPWSPQRGVSFALPPDARGHYTLYVRARGAGGREGLYAARWPLFVDRHTLADNADPRRTIRSGAWRRSSDVLGFNGSDYEQAEPAGAPASFVWSLSVPEGGTYRVLACWTEGDFRATDANFTVSLGSRQIAEARVDQRGRGGAWVELARVPLSADAECRVELTNDADGVVVADAIRVVRSEE